MGSMSAMSSIKRVLERHGEELAKEHRIAKDGTRFTYLGPVLENNLYSIQVLHKLRGEDNKIVHVLGATIDIDELADRFEDCEVGY